MKDNFIEFPVDRPHYQYKKLKLPERVTIQIIYYDKWRRFVKQAKLSKDQAAYFKIYFQEIHARYYHKVVKGGSYVTGYRLIKNFLLSKANENIRAILQAQSPFNLTIFVHGLRSQIELNALLEKFLKDEEYLKKFIIMNDDRSKIKETDTVININTLVKKLDSTGLKYQKHYDDLSLLLHPNPTGVKFYAQAKGERTSDSSGMASPNIKFYFDETVSKTEDSTDWFKNNTWTFLSYVEHFLILFDELKDIPLFISESEEKQYCEIATMEAFMKNEKYFLKIANNAFRNKEDVGQAIQKGFSELFSNDKAKK